VPAVTVSDLVVAYGSRRAVDGLSFTAEAGEVLAVVGPNGAGKTSTVEACVGLQPIASGSVEVRGRSGIMLQEGGLYPTARPLELVRHVAGLYPQAEDPAELLTALGIDPATRTTIRRLSGGEQQRVKCAAALVGRPDVVFLDEPTAGLDSAGRRIVHDLIRGLTDHGTTVVLTTHLMDDVERLADRLLVVSHGRDVHHGTVDALIGTATSIWIDLPSGVAIDSLRPLLTPDTVIRGHGGGLNQIDAPAKSDALRVVVTWCAESGVADSSVSVGRRSLEDAVQAVIEGKP